MDKCGRKAVTNMAWYLGMDIGGTKCAVVVGKEDGVPLARRSFATASLADPHQILQKMAALGKELLAGEPLVAVGVSCGGPLDPVAGTVLSPPNLPGWDEIPVTQIFTELLGAPCYLQNDANACALAEWKFGAAKGCSNAVFLTFGTGLGGGLILNGRLYEGANAMAGEVGHLRLTRTGPAGYGVRGSFEGWCSGGGIARLAKMRLGRNTTAKQLADDARAGDAGALAVWDECGRRLGQGLALLVDILNPECIVIGSIFARAGDLLRPAMEKELAAAALPLNLSVCRVVLAALGDAIGDVAALAVAINGRPE